MLSFVSAPEIYASEEIAVFAGGCFWCLEHDLEKLPGVVDAESGYTGGVLENPTYLNHNGHQEAVKVRFKSDEISYESLLRAYWLNIDPYDGDGQFCDRGNAYKPVIFTRGEDQQIAAEKSVQDFATELAISKRSIKVQVKKIRKFWLAENYHQNYAERNSLKYNFYRSRCGRDNRLKTVWGET